MLPIDVAENSVFLVGFVIIEYNGVIAKRQRNYLKVLDYLFLVNQYLNHNPKLISFLLRSIILISYQE